MAKARHLNIKPQKNDTIGAEILLVWELCVVGLLVESDEWDNEKIFVTIKLF